MNQNNSMQLVQSSPWTNIISQQKAAWFENYGGQETSTRCK